MSYVGNVIAGSDTHLVGSTLYGVCSTTASTAAKVVSLEDYDSLLPGTTIHVKFQYSNTAANPTLNVNGTGAYPIYLDGVNRPGTTALLSWAANSVVSFTYDSRTPGAECWRMNDSIANAANASITAVNTALSSEVTRATGVEGSFRADFAPAYSTSSTYKVGQLCVYSNKLYRCTTAITTAEAWNSGHWTQTTVGAEIENRDLYFTGVTCSATTGNFVNLSDSRITTDHVLDWVRFARPDYITSDYTWSTNTAGKVTINGTCKTATTCDLKLSKKNN